MHPYFPFLMHPYFPILIHICFPVTQTFYKRMLRDREHIFTCLFIPEVPPNNNASERAIRNIKVKQKISGQFKCAKAAQNFAKIRSVIDTTIKNKLNVIEALSLVPIFGLETTRANAFKDSVVFLCMRNPKQLPYVFSFYFSSKLYRLIKVSKQF